MFEDHYMPLVLAYLVGLGGWLLANRLFANIWPKGSDESFERPWKELGIAFLGTVGIIGMGQLWTNGIRLPEQGSVGPVLASVNQILIFAPILLVVVVRHQAWTSAWLPREHIPERLLAGLLLSVLSVCAYSVLRRNADAPWVILGRIWRYDHLDEIVQVFLEDLTIAILFVRLASAIGKRWAVMVVALLFALGHIPAMLSQGATGPELLGLLRDAGLGIAVILVVQRSRDVVWFCFIHFCLDLTQFTKISGAG
jgi:Type II CAAX prenyl endopeptidase Rce1-like